MTEGRNKETFRMSRSLPQPWGGSPTCQSSLELGIWVKGIRQDSGGGGVFPESREARVQKPQGGREKGKTSFISSHSPQLAFEGCLYPSQVVFMSFSAVGPNLQRDFSSS